MSLAKEAQNLDGFSVPMAPPEPERQVVRPDESAQPLPSMPQEPEALEDSALADDMQGTLLIQVDEGDPVEMFDFTLPLVPGGADQSDLEPATIEVEEENEIEVESDPWKWNVTSFLDWLQGMMKGVPSHSGKDTAGCERAISYLEALDKEISIDDLLPTHIFDHGNSEKPLTTELEEYLDWTDPIRKNPEPLGTKRFLV